MAIDSTKKLGLTSTKSSCSKSSNKSSRRVVTYTADESNSSYKSKYDTSKKKKKISPYLGEDRVEVLSRITEKRLVRKKTTDFVSSYPLAVNIYKASSDEFKALKKSKKVKKSVLTLPNEPAPLPQPCTVSDMNESEYFDDVRDKRKLKPKKMRAIQPNRKPRMNKAIEVFDRDAEYCSRLNIDLDRSSTDLVHQYTGDGKKVSTKRRYNKSNKSDANPHDVWAMLRNMNRFPFKASPPLSVDSLASIKKNLYNNRRNNQMNTKLIESRTTEEFTYFSSLVDKSTYSQSSIDRITVIDKENEYREFHEEVKVLNNKIPSKARTQKNTKKVKGIARKRRDSVKTADGEKRNEKQTNEKDVNPKIRIEFSDNFKGFRNNRQSRCNSPNSESCTNNCFYCQNIFSDKNKKLNNSADLLNLCGNSDSSNADIIKNDTCTKMSSCDSQVPIIGITRVVLSKGENVLLTEKDDSFPKRIRMPSAASHPKLTVTDIRRRLVNIKFPLVILGKDQLTSAPFPVTDYTPPHFAALNEHIWPFMQNWQTNNQNGISKCNKRLKPVLRTTQGMKGFLENNNDDGSNNNVKKSIAIRNIVQPDLISNTENEVKPPKMKPVRQFKERMLQFLHRHPSSDGDTKRFSTQEFSKRKDIRNHVDVATNTQRSLAVEKDRDEILSKREDEMLKCFSSNTNHPCIKGRWASDFIDNVIKKIRSGIYYNQDEKESSGGRNCKTREESVQTAVNVINNDLCVNCIKKSNPVFEHSRKIKYDNVLTIPGFDESLLDLQIETISRDTIAVKHCVTNIIVQFDVAIPSEVNRVGHFTQSESCVPISVTQSHAKIFKSKTTIINAVLPAEICSILPKTMKKIIGSKLLLPKMIDVVEPHLSPIVELTQVESGNPKKHLIPVRIRGSPELTRLGQGNFAKYDMLKITTKTISNITYKLTRIPYSFEEFYLPEFGRNLLKHYHISQIAALRVFETNHSRNQEPEIENRLFQPKTKCMALQSYSLDNKRVAPAFKFNFVEFIVAILSNPMFSVQISMPLKKSLSGLNSVESIEITMDLEVQHNNNSCAISNEITGCVYKSLQNNKAQSKISNSYLKKQKPITNSKHRNSSRLNKFENCKSGFEYSANNIRNMKNNYVKLYRKCKSMSSISSERSSISLSKIITLEDFFLALGSAKSLASIFDENRARIILTSIKEMKNWISDITPRQALLVLLLANKKDTSNLVRYRPVILQGIAVKRITRASELDMEIEVIERENLSTFSQYEGISYLPASIENQDSLLEELCWIAKTTASDYQKPFDESSERLLKSLLEKRKKLNPSYLCVMARYVGLGLLKSPKANSTLFIKVKLL